MRPRPHRNHPAYWAFVGHRLSGLALAVFLPFHFLLLGEAIAGAAALDAGLRAVDMPFFRIAEWGLVTALALHLFFGLRVLALEMTRWPGLDRARGSWIVPGAVAAVFIGIVYIAG